MEQDFFANIPSGIIVDILSTLPVPSIIICKCVCKSWRSLIESTEFVKTHLSKAIPGLAASPVLNSNVYNFFEFEDIGLDLEHHQLHFKLVTKFNIPPCNGKVVASANGLVFCKTSYLPKHQALHICNPITREYIELDCNEFDDSGLDVVTYGSGSCNITGLDVVTYGFGSSKITRQHKVVRIFQDYACAPLGHVVPNSECVCLVYTIGTGLWRRIPAVSHLVYRRHTNGAFLNGNLHWPVSHSESPQLLISCFDLETQCFSTFSSPILKTAFSTGPTILGDCLCLCDDTIGIGVDIWVMKEYGVEESWTKQFFIGEYLLKMSNWTLNDAIYPIKIFKDGDILLAWKNEILLYSKKKDIIETLLFEHVHDIKAFLYTPTILSLKSFGMENVISF